MNQMNALPQIQFSQQEPGTPFDRPGGDSADFDSIVDSQSRSIRKIKSNMQIPAKDRPPLPHSKSQNKEYFQPTSNEKVTTSSVRESDMSDWVHS